MSEIKSTLDLIMERTKDLTLSADEKKEIHRKELEERVKGWVQRCLDGTLLPSALEKELTGELEKDSDLTSDILHAEITGRLDPDEDNDRLLELLEKYVVIKRDVVTEKLDNFRSKASVEQRRLEEPLTARLADADIRGSAIIPNIYKDREWKDWHAQARDELKRELSVIRGS